MRFGSYMRIITIYQWKRILKYLANKSVFQVLMVLMSTSCMLRTCLQAAEINIWSAEGPRSSGSKEVQKILDVLERRLL